MAVALRLDNANQLGLCLSATHSLSLQDCEKFPNTFWHFNARINHKEPFKHDFERMISTQFVNKLDRDYGNINIIHRRRRASSISNIINKPTGSDMCCCLCPRCPARTSYPRCDRILTAITLTIYFNGLNSISNNNIGQNMHKPGLPTVIGLVILSSV